MTASCLGLSPPEIRAGSANPAVPGWDVRVLDEQGGEVEAGQIGSLAVRLPLPPGMLPTLWNDHLRYLRSYFEKFEGYYQTADAGYIDSDGYVYVMARTDDIINVAGHRLSTGAIEEVLSSHPAVAECAVIGIADSLKGQLPLGVIVLKAGVASTPDEVIAETIALVRRQMGPVISYKQAVVVARLPKTRSGKVLRATMRCIADGEPWEVPATIEDEAVLGEIQEAFEAG